MDVVVRAGPGSSASQPGVYASYRWVNSFVKHETSAADLLLLT